MHHATKKRIASMIWPKFSPVIEVLNRNADMTAKLRTFRGKGVPMYEHRTQLYEAINERLRNSAITYLEFGVWKGESIQAWSEINSNPESRFVGFDSFEGLPEDWSHALYTTKKGAFDLQGSLPNISDSRVGFRKGWFQATLRDFLAETPLRHPLVINNDSDLLSSTQYTLATLDPFIKSGDVLIFDEYSSALNEYLAWEQYQKAFMRESECVGMSDHATQVAFVFKK